MSLDETAIKDQKMKVFIMRHGEAAHYAASDAERELTKHGRSQSTAVAMACKKQGCRHKT